MQELWEYVRENNPSLYWAAKAEEHESQHGKHFDEEFASEVVDNMYHKCADGSKKVGEHWSIDEVKAAIEKFRLPKDVTCWDAYVALNMWWHDLGRNYKQRDAENYDTAIIADALTWAFMDDDAPDGKIWRYFGSLM